MHAKGGSPVAFIEYQDVRFAAQAMATLQGSFLLSSDRGAIRIEYAKSKMAEYPEMITRLTSQTVIRKMSLIHDKLLFVTKSKEDCQVKRN
ncbi:Uncharacterized protein GBIM_06685 [Gryllus bimaculatus]|nr:Uncharacterized protein GBIM_06685 [Gryllus bimaculatus]